MANEARVAKAQQKTRELPPLDIRPIQPNDVNQVRQLIADSTYPFELKLSQDIVQLARLSNRKIYFHPYTLAIWSLLLAALVSFSGVLKTGDWGRALLFSVSLTGSILIAGEWVTRNHFEAKATEVLRADSSLQDFQKFYGRNRFLVATLGGDQVIGLVGLQIEGEVGTVNHWYVNALYRNRGLGWDLMEYVIKNAKESTKNSLRMVKCQTYNMQTRAEKSLRDHGFKRTGGDTPEPGLLGWFDVKTRTWSLEF